MIAVNMNLGSKKHGSKFFECFNDGEKFLFNSSVKILSFVEFVCVEGNWMAFLFDDSTKLKVRGMGLNIKWNVMVRICKQ